MDTSFTTLKINRKSPTTAVFDLVLNRPKSLNALSQSFFSDFPAALASLDQNPDCNAVVLSASGPHFCSGLDLSTISNTITSNGPTSQDRGRIGEKLRRSIKFLQDAVTAVERCRKPVIAAVHGACVGGGVDLVTACDVRYCTEDAFFCVKEVDVGIVADLGTLQRLPGIVGYGNAMELSLTGRRVSSKEAKEMGLVSKVFESKDVMDENVRSIAEVIAAKSPLAVTGTKAILLKSRDMNLDQALDYVATWNSAMLLSDDLTEAFSAQRQKRKPVFSKL